jgi:hypothetical protein
MISMSLVGDATLAGLCDLLGVHHPWGHEAWGVRAGGDSVRSLGVEDRSQVRVQGSGGAAVTNPGEDRRVEGGEAGAKQGQQWAVPGGVSQSISAKLGQMRRRQEAV